MGKDMVMLSEEEIRKKVDEWEKMYTSIKGTTNRVRVEGFIKGLKFVLEEPMEVHPKYDDRTRK
jgi:hypothetical protein